MPTPTDPVPTAHLLILESGAAFPFQAAGYRGGHDTAIIVQQRGEPTESLRNRIRHAARELELSGVRVDMMALVIATTQSTEYPERAELARVLLDQLEPEGTLVLVADAASPVLQQSLLGLVGDLIERDGVKQTVAVDFDAKHMAELRAARVPPVVRAPKTVLSACAAC